MIKVLRLILAVFLGLVIGSVVNMSFILVNGQVFPLPPGADMTTMEGVKEALPLLQPKHFVFPFLAHAVGTLVGAFLAGLVAPGKSIIPACIVGGMFLLGGITNVLMLPAPIWFDALDLLLAYGPTAWLGQKLASLAKQSGNPAG